MSIRPAQVRFYIDADILGFGQLIASLRNDVTYPGDPGLQIHKRERPPCPITSTDVLDTEWIPEVARRGWLIVTRDNRISEKRREVAAVRENAAKMVALNQRDASTKWGQLEVFMSQWRRIEALTRACCSAGGDQRVTVSLGEGVSPLCSRGAAAWGRPTGR